MDSMTLVKKYFPQQKQVSRLPKRDLIQDDITLGELLTKHFAASAPSEVVPLTLLIVWSDRYESDLEIITYHDDDIEPNHHGGHQYEVERPSSPASIRDLAYFNDLTQASNTELQVEELQHPMAYNHLAGPFHQSAVEIVSEESQAVQTLQILANQQSSPTLPVNTTIIRKVCSYHCLSENLFE